MFLLYHHHYRLQVTTPSTKFSKNEVLTFPSQQNIITHKVLFVVVVDDVVDNVVVVVDDVVVFVDDVDNVVVVDFAVFITMFSLYFSMFF